MTRMLWLWCPGVAACPSVRTPISTLRDVLHSALISTSGHLHSRQLFLLYLPLLLPSQTCIYTLHPFACTIFFIVYPSNLSPGNIGQRLNMGESGRCFMPAKYLMLHYGYSLCSFQLGQEMMSGVRRHDEDNSQWKLALVSSSGGFEGCRRTQTPPLRPSHL